MACLDDNALFELSAGELSGEALQAAEQHVDACATCRRALAEALRTSGARPQPLPALLPAGTVVGRYQVLERVGAGAMGQVFAAYDPQLDRRVALKLLRPGSSGAEQRARLGREAQTLARLSHPNVVTVFDVGTWGEQLFITLEFVAGGSARSWLAAAPRSWREVVDLFVQAGRGLAAAHAAGVVHRDFKPDNVLVRADGRAQVTDFGLAASNPSARPEPAETVELTRSDVLLGTPVYMAADQLTGAQATPASDQFSYCAALFEALEGARPFEEETVAALIRSQRAGAVRPQRSQAPAAVQRALLRGLSAQPAQRFPSMAALVDALEAVTARPRRAGQLAAVAALVVLGVAVAVARGPRALQPACALAQARHLEQWGPSQRAVLERAFAATGVSYAALAFARVDAAMRPRVEAWSAARAEACEAVMGPRPSALFQAQLLCLDERLAELDATVRVLGAGGQKAVDGAAHVVEQLAEPGACTGSAALARLAADAGPCETCVADQAQAARAQALFDSGDFAQAGAVAQEGLSGAVHSATARAALSLEAAKVLEEQGKLDEAEAAFFVAGLEAQRSGDAALGAASWAELGYLVGYLRSRADEGERWAAQAEALAALGPPQHLDERVASVRGAIAARRGKLPEAEVHFSRAEALVRARLGPEHPARARALSNLGNAQLHQGHLDTALPTMEEAWKLLVASLGEEHPDTFKALNSWGAALGTAERYEAAIPVFTRALAGYQKTVGPEHPRIGTAALNLAEAERRVGSLEPAAAHYAQAAAVWAKTDAAERALALAGQAQVLLDLGRPAAALPLLEEAGALCERLACEPIDEGQARFILARTLRALGRPEAQVLTQARRARALLTPLEEAADEVQALERFLAPRGGQDRR